MGNHRRRKAKQIIENAYAVLAIELLCGAQAADFRDPSCLGWGRNGSMTNAASLSRPWRRIAYLRMIFTSGGVDEADRCRREHCGCNQASVEWTWCQAVQRSFLSRFGCTILYPWLYIIFFQNMGLLSKKEVGSE